MGVTYDEKMKEHYRSLLEKMEHKNAGWTKAFTNIAKKIAANRNIYEKISKATNGVPWYFIGVLHNLESGCNFNKHLHNGDSLQRRTVREPKNYPRTHAGPFTFFESAVDALKLKNLHKITDWSIEHMCYKIEEFNGWGYYRYKGINSPYLWSGTNLYSKGKYYVDGKYNPNLVSQQAGAIPVLLLLRDMDRNKVDIPADALTKDEAVRKSSKLTVLSRVRDFIKFTFVSLGGLLTFDNLSIAKAWTGDLVSSIGVYQLFTIAGILVGVWVLSKWLEIKSIEDLKDGRYIPSGAKET